MLLLASCMSFSDTKADYLDSAQAGGDFDTGAEEADDSSTDSADGIEPGWYALTAELDIVAGAVTIGSSFVTLLVLGEDAETEACDMALDLSTLAAATPPDPAVAWWWTVEVPVDGCAAVPGPLGFGIGEMQADVAAWLGAEGLSAGALYGAYVQAPAGELYAYGWAGTAQDAASDEIASFPPPDGRYAVVPLYLLHL